MDHTFLFVNHDAATLGSRTNFKIINTHMQKYHRKQRDKTLRRPLSNSLPVDELRIVQGQKVAPSYRSSTAAALNRSNTKSNPAQGMIGCRSEPDVEDAVFQSCVPSLGLTSILQKGNRDPFSSLAVPINPITNLILSWHRDVDLPGQYPYESRSNGSFATGRQRDWQHAVTALHEPCIAYAFISSIAACMTLSTGRQDCAKLSLVSNIKASQILRSYLAAGYAWTGMKVYHVIIYLFWADIATENLAPAGLHLQMLYQLIRTHHSPEAFDPWWRGRIMWADVEYAAMQLSGPLFDVDQWSFETYYTNWIEESKFEDYWNSNPQLSFMDRSITDEALRAVFRDLKKLLAVEHFLTLCQLPVTCSVFQWMRARKIRCESQLLSMYADTFCLTQDKDMLPSANDQLVKGCTCLAAISWVAIGFDYIVESKKKLQHIVQRKYNLLLSRLQETIIRCCNLLLPRLRLWVLFVGAVIEQRVGSESGGAVFGTWHQTRLAKQASLMGMQSFHQIRQVLLDFLFLDRLNLHWRPVSI